MKISYNWLQTYFKEPLPSPEKVAEAFTFHAFEVESIEKTVTDTIFDLKVLPDRVHYAYSHKGIALELSAILNLERKEKSIPISPITLDKKARVRVEDAEACPRYMARFIENITVQDSPEWLKKPLEAVGQRSINNIVDVTNYILLDREEPLHAFDADKIQGTLTLRFAKKGEKIVVLDGREIPLDESIFLEADETGPLAIAGIKGGKFAGIDASTKNILLVAANFNPTMVRKTSMKIGIRSDASKRFENNLSPSIVEEGLEGATSLIKELCPEAKIGPVSDFYPNPVQQKNLTVSISAITTALGVEIPSSEVIGILSRLEIKVIQNGDMLDLEIPLYRNDLTNLWDIVEEVGRIYGYDKIPPTIPRDTTFKPHVEKTFYYSEKIKNIMVDLGFSEVYTYSLVPEGVYEIEKPLAADKNHLRANLAEGVARALDLNQKNADFLGLDEIKIFEVGKVFTKEGEKTSFAFGMRNTKKKQQKESEKTAIVSEKLAQELGVDKKYFAENKGTVEVDVEELIKNLPDPASYEALYVTKTASIEYKPFSHYPFITRDIAIFVPSDVDALKPQEIIKAAAGNLLIKGPDLFDQFEKEGKKSLAFRMIFQAFDRTLTDEEVNGFMEKVYAAVKEKGWQVR